MKIALRLEVEVARTEGMNLSRDEVIEALIEEVEQLDPGALTVYADRGEAEYEIQTWEITEQEGMNR